MVALTEEVGTDGSKDLGSGVVSTMFSLHSGNDAHHGGMSDVLATGDTSRKKVLDGSADLGGRVRDVTSGPTVGPVGQSTLCGVPLNHIVGSGVRN